MEQTIPNTGREIKARKNNRTDGLSPDGKWKSFPKVPNLLQYVSTGLYFARVKVQGKLIRRGLDTDVFSVAKLRLADFKKKQSEPKPEIGTFGAALRAYLRSLNGAHDIGNQTKRYRRYCVRALLKSWPGLRAVRLEKLRLVKTNGEAFKDDSAFKLCQDWAQRFSEEKDGQYFNNTLSVLRSVLEIGGIPPHENPARRVKRIGISLEHPAMPEPDQFQKIIELMENSGAGQQQACADFARFLAFSGCRLSEARQVTWADVELAKGFITVHNAKTRRGKNHSPTRRVPIIPDMRTLLERLKLGNPKPEYSVCKVGECEKSLARACSLVGIPKLTHHDLRHLFATRCIEAGVDIPTVSRWLGHSDGGALAMKVYGHLREKHSADMAQKVTFGESTKSEVAL